MMDENISIKYAVYVKKDGNEILEVVRDAESEARKDFDALKQKSSYVRIDKANVKNFGKDDEKTISSEVITSWDSSSDGKSGENNITGNANDVVSAPSAVPTPSIAIASSIEPKKETWQDYYAKHGALVYSEGWAELTKMKEKPDVKPELTPAIADNNGQAGAPINSPIVELKNDGGAASLSDADVDKIAEKLKEKLGQNGVQVPANIEPQKTPA